MNRNDYIAVECLNIPKILVTDADYRSLSFAAKMLYSLCLDRTKFTGFNRWKDEDGEDYIIYTRSEMMRDLGCGRHSVDHALEELKNHGGMIRVTRPRNGFPNRIYVKDITLDAIHKKTNGEQEKAPESLEEMMKGQSFQGEKKECLEKFTVSEDDEETDFEEKKIRLKARTAEEEAMLRIMEEYGFVDGDGYLDIDMIEEDADELGIELGLSIPDRCHQEEMGNIIALIDLYLSTGEKKPLIAILETMVAMLGVSVDYTCGLSMCFGKARKIYLKAVINSLVDILANFLEREEK